MRADDDGIPRLQADERLKYSRRCRVRRRNDRCYQANRFCNLLDSKSRIFFDHPACLRVLICIIDILCSIVVLDDLIFYDAASRLLDCLLRKGDTHLVGRKCRFIEYLIYLFLCVCSKYFLSLSHRFHLSFESFYAVDNCWYCFLFLRHFNVLP